MRKNFPVTGIEYPLGDAQSLISRTDTKGRITYVNEDFVEMSGFSEEELLGSPHNIVRHPDMPPEAFEDMWNSLKEGNSWTGMVKNRRKSGDHYWVLANATPIFENGTVVGYTSVRTKPDREQIEAAEKAYALFREGKHKGLRIREGKVVHTGAIGLLRSLRHLSLRTRMLASVAGLSLCILTVGGLGIYGMSVINGDLLRIQDNYALAMEKFNVAARSLHGNQKTFSEPPPADSTTPTGTATRGDDSARQLHEMQTLFDSAVAETKHARDQYARMRNSIVAGAIVAFIFALLFGSLLLRAIFRPLVKAVDTAKQIAAGNLTGEIPVNSSDEIGQMLHALNVMQKSLSNIIGGVRGSAETISTGAQQIASGNADLSSRTEAQASALEETAASMEELSSTVKSNEEHSQGAWQLAQSARGAAVEGGSAMDQMVGTMDSITQSSRKITDIIGVIDGIAFQTNILALNAAVEAARAGEQGRGFAVVASEVRNLAQRSAAAAKEIKCLIDESVSKVESGSQQVMHVRATMETIVSTVQKVADMMNEISHAAREQTAGISQVNEAVMLMDDDTQKNAALVEQAAAASVSLHQQAASLVRSVGVFRLRSERSSPKAASEIVQRSPSPALPDLTQRKTKRTLQLHA